MKVLVTGATGVLGRNAVASLVAGGHEVHGVARRPDAAAGLRDLGAEPVALDLFDAGAVRKAVAGSDAVCHLATRIPPLRRAWRRSAWVENDRLRRDATRILADAAIEHAVEAFLAESVTFPYPDRDEDWIDEDVPFASGEDPRLASVAALEAETARMREAGARGIVLRFALFYGPEAHQMDDALRMARLRIAPAMGPGDAYLSSVHQADAGAAVAAALRAPAGVYNVADDEPLRRAEYSAAFASAFGFGRLRPTPPALLRAVGGRSVEVLLRSQRVGNRRFRAATGWAPEFPNARAGWRAVAVTRGAKP